MPLPTSAMLGAATAVLLIVSLSPCTARVVDVAGRPSDDGKATVIDLNESHSLELLQHWLDQALSGFMAAVATKKINNVNNATREAHEQCSKAAKDVPAHAECVVRLLDAEKRFMARQAKKEHTMKKHSKKHTSHTQNTSMSKYASQKTKVHRRKPIPATATSAAVLPHDVPVATSTMLAFVDAQKRLQQKAKQQLHRRRQQAVDEDEEWVGGFKQVRRARRSVVTKSEYTLQSDGDRSPFALLARQLTRAVRTVKHKDAKEAKDWNAVIDEIQEEAAKLKAQKKIKKMFQKRLAMIQDNTTTIDEHRPLAMKELDDLDESDPHALLEAAHKMEKQMTPEEKAMREPMKLIRQAIKLGVMAGGGNGSDIDDKTLKLASPRLMPIVPEEDDADKKQVNLLSPSLFSLHRGGKGIERATSLADGFGLVHDRDHEEWLNFVMEAAGVTDAVDYMKDEKIKKASERGLDDSELRSPSGQPLFFSKQNVTEMYGDPEARKIETFERLQRTFTPEQAKEQEETGYFIMSPVQIRIVYGPESPFNNSKTLKELSAIPKEDMHHHIEANIRSMSQMNGSSFALRQKDVVLTPVLFTPLVAQSALLSQPIILSPLVFSPSILSPAVLGPVVLGPWVFVPVILSPRVLAPLILNPLIFSPIVLSPLVLHPLILSPGIFNPIVLSPLVLSPFILSPQVFTPLILSPFVLNPLILNPMVGSPLILSPFVLSPIILSPQLLFAVVLSPYALSPLIQSELIISEVVLSPSWLS